MISTSGRDPGVFRLGSSVHPDGFVHGRITVGDHTSVLTAIPLVESLVFCGLDPVFEVSRGEEDFVKG